MSGEPRALRREDDLHPVAHVDLITLLALFICRRDQMYSFAFNRYHCKASQGTQGPAP
jgi:hypothetical protein